MGCELLTSILVKNKKKLHTWQFLFYGFLCYRVNPTNLRNKATSKTAGMVTRVAGLAMSSTVQLVVIAQPIGPANNDKDFAMVAFVASCKPLPVMALAIWLATIKVSL